MLGLLILYSDIWKVPFYLKVKWVIWHATFFFACGAQDYTFCLLIVRYMLSDKMKGKSALKAQTFLHERDKKKVHVCYWFSIDGKQCRLKYF